MRDSVTAVVDMSEVLEAAFEIAAWNGREAVLPRELRDEMAVVNAMEPAEVCLVVVEGGHAAVILSPRVRALIGNLRAQRRVRP